MAEAPTGIVASIISLIRSIFEYIVSEKRETRILKEKKAEAETQLATLNNEIKLQTLQFKDVSALFVKRVELINAIDKLNQELNKKKGNE